MIVCEQCSEHQIREGIEDNSRTNFLTSQQKTYIVTPHKDRLGETNNGSQNMFLIEKYGSLSLNYFCSPFLSGALSVLGKWVL